MDCPSKITNFYHIFMQEYVLRLEVSMQDIISMHVLYPLTDLLDIFSHDFLRESANFFQVLIEILAQTGLKDEVSSLLVDEEVVEVHNLRVVEKTLYFYLSDKLI